MSKNKGSCYVCGKAATGRDHTPPKMLFPELKDSDGVDYRVNLKTVPACKDHNDAFSKDDTYFTVVVTTQIANNQVGLDHFAKKILTALHVDQKLKDAVFANLKPAIVNGQATGSFTVDVKRFERCVHKVTAGIYHSATGFRLPDWSIMKVLSPDLHLPGSMEAPYAHLAPLFKEAPAWKTVRSGHPDVYQCRYVIADKRPRHFAFEHMFFGGMRIWVVANPSDALWLT